MHNIYILIKILGWASLCHPLFTGNIRLAESRDCEYPIAQ